MSDYITTAELRKKFQLEHLVITSLVDIDVEDWCDYFIKNFDEIVGTSTPHKTVVIGTGVHDTLRVHPLFYRQDLAKIEWLKGEYSPIKEKIDRLKVGFLSLFLIYLFVFCIMHVTNFQYK